MMTHLAPCLGRQSRLAGACQRGSARIAAVLAGFLCCLAGAYAGDMTPESAQSDAAENGSSVLDGRSFSGEIGHAGKDAFDTDVWVFRNGMFASKDCEKCGFPESPYWVRFEDDGVRFKAKTQCPRTDAIIEWKGMVKGDRIEGTFTWTKERWYWTIEKEFWFKGKLVDSEVAMTEE